MNVRIRITGISNNQFKHVADVANYLANHANEIGIEEFTPHAQSEEPPFVYELDLFPVVESEDVAKTVQHLRMAVQAAMKHTEVGALAEGGGLLSDD
jgi:hypothetical protein